MVGSRTDTTRKGYAEAIADAEALGLTDLAAMLRRRDESYCEDVRPMIEALKARAPAAMNRTESEHEAFSKTDRRFDDQAVQILLHDWAQTEMSARGDELMYVIGPADAPVIAWSGSKSDGIPHDRYLWAMQKNPCRLQTFIFHRVVS